MPYSSEGAARRAPDSHASEPHGPNPGNSARPVGDSRAEPRGDLRGAPARANDYRAHESRGADGRAADGRGNESDLIANRKLIRPSLSGLREQMAAKAAAPPPPAAPAPHRIPKKPVPPEQTNAEAFYYVKQMQAKTPVVLVLRDGEQIRGILEWYDRHCLKVHRSDGPNLLIYKSNVKYLYKADEGKGE